MVNAPHPPPPPPPADNTLCNSLLCFAKIVKIDYSKIAKIWSLNTNSQFKRIEITYHFIRSETKNGSIAMSYVPSEENMADIFTKPITKGKFSTLLKNIMGIQ